MLRPDCACGQATVCRHAATTLTNLTVSGNTTNGSVGVGLDHNLVGDNSGSSLTAAPSGSPDVTGNLTGTAITPIDPLLNPLADNGRYVLTEVPQTGSPVIDAGGSGCTGASATDARGSPRPQGAACDIGAVEAILDRIFADGFEGA